MNIIKYSEEFGLKLEALAKELPQEMDPLGKMLIEWFHLFILNEFVPAIASLQMYLENNDPRKLAMLLKLYETVRDKFEHAAVKLTTSQ